MIRFFHISSSFDDFHGGLEQAGNTLGLRLKAPYEASVAWVEAKKGAAI